MQLYAMAGREKKYWVLRISYDQLQSAFQGGVRCVGFDEDNMNKSELILKVAKETKLSRIAAEEVVESTIENIMKALKQGDDVRLMGFGVFSVARRKAGIARNPKTGKAVKTVASRRAKFKPGKLLKEAVNG